MAKKQVFNMEDYLRNNLQVTLREEFGRKTIERTEMPEYFGFISQSDDATTSLSKRSISVFPEFLGK